VSNLSTKLAFLAHKALNLRILSLQATTVAGSGHPTSCLSAAEIVAVLFFEIMRYDPADFNYPNNDRFILSKGHAAPLLYAAWEQVGVLTKADLLTLRQIDSNLEGHPTARFERFEAATGSLGQGLGVGVGMALAGKLDYLDFRTYVLLGDSECTEGSIWEAAELASYYKLNNLIAIVDLNRLGQTGATVDGHDSEKLAGKFQAFGWFVITVDGHDLNLLLDSFAQAQKISDKPVAIIAKTYKGYGIADVQDQNGFHGKAFSSLELPGIIAGLENGFKAVYGSINPYGTLPAVALALWRTGTTNVREGLDNREEKKISAIPDTFQASHKASPDTVVVSDLDASPTELLAKTGRSDKFYRTISTSTLQTYQLSTKIATRQVYGDLLVDLATQLPNLVSLDAEVKNSTYAEKLEQVDPAKFIQCFIAEQNMISMGVGLAARHKIPFISTFGVFFTRAFDQIRMAAIGKSPLRLVGSHCGVSIGEDGPSQMALEDLAMFRTIPDSIIFYPSDAVSCYKLGLLMANYNTGISYLRTTRAATPVIYNSSEEFRIGGAKILRQSTQDQVCLVAAGITLHEALQAYEILKLANIFVTVIDLYAIKPLDHELLISSAQQAGYKIITIEDHYLAGGLGEAVNSAVINTGIQVHNLAVLDLPRSGKSVELLAMFKIDAQAIVAAVRNIIA
jgi:transketolase